MTQPDKSRAPDALIHCDRCGSNFLIWFTGAPDDIYQRILRELDRTVCPDCIREMHAAGELGREE